MNEKKHPHTPSARGPEGGARTNANGRRSAGAANRNAGTGSRPARRRGANAKGRPVGGAHGGTRSHQRTKGRPTHGDAQLREARAIARKLNAQLEGDGGPRKKSHGGKKGAAHDGRGGNRNGGRTAERATGNGRTQARDAHGGGRGPAKARANGNARPNSASSGAPRRAASAQAGPCAIARQCGACSCIDVPYGDQLAEKQRRVEELFADLAPSPHTIEPIAGMEDPFGYRDKIASPFAPGRVLPARAHGKRRGRDEGERRAILCGMYAAGTHRIVEALRCPVEHPAGRRVIEAVRQIMAAHGIEPYDEDAGTGFIRHVVVRVGHESGEVLVTVVTNDRAFPNAKNFARELVRRCPEVTTVVQNVNTRATNAILGDEEHAIYGPGFILDTLCGLSFRISSHSFYQVNAVQTEVLYRTALDMAGLGGEGDRAGSVPAHLLDAYCGTGTIGLVAAASAPGLQVTGVEKVASAVRDARQNAAHNGIENAEFVCEDATAYLRRRAAEGQALDVLMMDPPRSGSTPEFLDAACALAPARIVYISCNPETQVRDVRRLARGGYRLCRLRAVDMFPHTDHIETVALLVRQ